MLVNIQRRSGNLVHHLTLILANVNKLNFGNLPVFYCIMQFLFSFYITAFRSMLTYQILAAHLLLLCKHKNIPISIPYFSCAVDRLVGVGLGQWGKN